MNRPNHTSGFSLIEIILSLLVVAVGVIAMLGLLGSALDASGRAREDLHTVSFADMVINYCNAHDSWDEIPTSGTLTLPDYTGTMTDLPIGSTGRFEGKLPTSNTNLIDVFTVTCLLNISELNSNVKQISLLVWPGFNTNGIPREFYSEIYNWAGR